ncbi:MAG: chromosome segregation protein SMC [Saprospiraceae bacterium]|nr:chromosome segregation protein SMC [Saprospiraceae bacterium]
MKLKSLEIKGFKSFAQDTVLYFSEPVIGIVGPNGSGKSNIVDAIRWVLGEQSNRELRLDQMANVLFNGTKSKKSSGLAQVTLTFENDKNILPTDYANVSISRLLYRSGESEYRLNGVACRLKDINNLLMDTGISSESYAIIALGMVDDILLDKENSRRRMIEQAAGISKYKIRKRETLTKLKATAEDLDRVEDLLHEINKNLEELEKQAKRTQKYLDLKLKYKTDSIALATLKIFQHKTEYKEIERQIAEKQVAYTANEASIHTAEAQISKIKKAHLDEEKLVNEKQKELGTFLQDLRTQENDKKIAEQRRSYLQSSESNWHQEVEKSKQRIAQLQKGLENWLQELPDAQALENTLSIELAEVEATMKSSSEQNLEVKAKYKSLLDQVSIFEAKKNEFEKQIAVAQHQNLLLNEELSRTKSEFDTMKEEIAAIKIQHTQLKATVENLTLESEKIQATELERQDDIQKSQSVIKQLNEQIQDIQRKMDALQNEYNLTKSMVENLEGFPESIRYLSKNTTWKTQAPLLSDLIYASEPYKIIIEAYLESYLNYYVVETWQDAQSAIKLLTEAQKGRANFFVMEALEDFHFTPKILPHLTPALEIVQIDPAYHKVAQFLLHDVYINESKSNNVETQLDDIQVIHLHQGIIQRRYSSHGGSVGLFEGKKLGRKKNLEILDQSIKGHQKEREQRIVLLRKENEALKSLESKSQTAELARITQALNRSQHELAGMEAKQHSILQFSENNQKREAEIIEAIATNTQAIQSMQSELAITVESLGLRKKEAVEQEAITRDQQEEISQKSNLFNQKKIAFIQQQNRVSALQKEKEFAERQIQEISKTEQEVSLRIANNTKDIVRLTAEISNFETVIAQHYETKKNIEQGLTQVESQYFQKKEEIINLENNLHLLFKSQSTQQGELQKLKDSFNETKHAIQSIADRVQVEFNISINDLINNPVDFDATELDRLTLEVFKQRNRIENFGEVNPMAVDTYEEMKTRYDTINEQKNDILTAKDNLSSTIKEIEKTATEQFMDAFEKIRDNFIKVFRSLFTNDDTCDLILEDPSSPLETGIQIIAKPKGKRPQSLNQLSGGEKTLTATALLFSLYLLKPAPFCIFDEVDAPLDDANIEKFNRIIKEFSKDSQFIVVTHNKSTMAAVDIIYGVYMDEPGVSSVSAVDFRHFEHQGLSKI